MRWTVLSNQRASSLVVNLLGVYTHIRFPKHTIRKSLIKIHKSALQSKYNETCWIVMCNKKQQFTHQCNAIQIKFVYQMLEIDSLHIDHFWQSSRSHTLKATQPNWMRRRAGATCQLSDVRCKGMMGKCICSMSKQAVLKQARHGHPIKWEALDCFKDYLRKSTK